MSSLPLLDLQAGHEASNRMDREAADELVDAGHRSTHWMVS
jgi:hypothetical protein